MANWWHRPCWSKFFNNFTEQVYTKYIKGTNSNNLLNYSLKVGNNYLMILIKFVFYL